MNKDKIKLFACDIDGTLTDGFMYQLEDGQEMKKFSCKDGAGFHILHVYYPDIKIVFITSEKAGINLKRFEKLNKLGVVDYFMDNAYGENKIKKLFEICKKNFNLFYDYDIEYFIKNNAAYIGDDTNDKELLEYVKHKACPSNSNNVIKKIKGIRIMRNKGGYGAVREYIDYLRRKKLLYKGE